MGKRLKKIAERVSLSIGVYRRLTFLFVMPAYSLQYLLIAHAAQRGPTGRQTVWPYETRYEFQVFQ